MVVLTSALGDNAFIKIILRGWLRIEVMKGCMFRVNCGQLCDEWKKTGQRVGLRKCVTRSVGGGNLKYEFGRHR